MIYPVKLFIDGSYKTSFNISSESSPNNVLLELDKRLKTNFKIKILTLNSFSVKYIKSAIKFPNPKESQESLIIFLLLKHYFESNRKHFNILLTCNDFKLQSSLNIKDFETNRLKVC